MTGSVETPATPVGTRLPEALVVGPQKAGTTWIHEYLTARGDVALPYRVKETFFLDRHWDRGLAWYASHFRPPDAVRAVEVAPTYFHVRGATDRALSALGQIPVVVTLRDPVRRTWSLWVHMRRYGMTKLPFAEAIVEHPELVDSSRYGTHLARWRRTMGETNVHVLFLDDLEHDAEIWAAGLGEALGLPAVMVPADLYRPVNEASMPASHSVARAGWKLSSALRSLGWHSTVEGAKRLGLKRLFFGAPGERPLPEPDEEELARLREELLPEIEETERLLGADLSHWKHPNL